VERLWRPGDDKVLIASRPAPNSRDWDRDRRLEELGLDDSKSEELSDARWLS